MNNQAKVLLAVILTGIILLLAVYQTGATDISVQIKHQELPISDTASGQTFNAQRTVDGATLQGSKL